MPITLNGNTGIVGPDGSASSPAIQGGDANTGMFFPAADTIAFAEGGVEVGRFDSSANFLFNSGYGSAAIAYGCRAWVNFNGTGTVAIRASGNVSSITDNGTGDYTVNFTTAMPDANYSFSFAGDVNTGVSTNDTRAVNFGAPAAGSLRVFTGNNYTSPVGEDWALICLSFFR